MQNKKALYYFKKMWPFFKLYKRNFIILVIIGLFTSSISILYPVLNAHLITNLTTLNFVKAKNFVLLIFMVQAGSRLIRFISFRNYEKTRGNIILNIRKYICRHLLELEVSNFDKYATGIFHQRIIKDSEEVFDVFHRFQLYIFDIIANFGILAYVFVINIPIGLLYLFSSVLLFIVNNKEVKERRKKRKDLKITEEKASSLLSEMVRGIRDIKILNLKKQFNKHSNQVLYDHFQKNYDLEQIKWNFWIVYRVLEELLVALIILFGIYLIINQQLSVVNLLIVFLYRHNIFNFLDDISELKQFTADFSLSSERIFELVEGPKFRKDKYGKKNIGRIKGKLEFKNVAFSYGSNQVFNNLNLLIYPNQSIAIVGRSGSGKSSIFNLISKLYLPDKGLILIDDVPINELSEASLRNNISIVSQHPYLFNMTIKENLKLAKENISDKEIITKCKMACIHDYIMTLPDQYDTLLGEGGVNLSGGQLQRLAIARALIKDTEIILFDEATSSLDNETQKAIQQSIRNISKDYTIIIIAHRLNTVIDCDRILVLDKGEIIAEGSHQQLIKDSDVYKELYQ